MCDQFRERLGAQHVLPGGLGAQHRSVDRARQAVRSRLEGGWAALANLRAAEGGIIALDGLDDIEQADSVGGFRQFEAALRPRHALKEAGPRQGLQVLLKVALRDAVVLRQRLAGQGRVRRKDGEQRGTVQAPLDAIAEFHISRIKYILDIVNP
jgi:hypothetical protein